MKKTLFAAAVLSASALAAPAAHAQQFINILTGGTSGVYYPLGVAIGKIYGEKISGVKTQVQATKASVENLNLIEQGRGELAFTLGDSLKAAVDGDEEAGFKKPLTKLRTIGAIYPNYIQIVASKESGIKTLADLKGKRLSVGAPKSGTELNARAILAASGIKYEDLGKVEYLPFAESVELIKNRQLDATLQSAGLGVASLKAAAPPGIPRLDAVMLDRPTLLVAAGAAVLATFLFAAAPAGCARANAGSDALTAAAPASEDEAASDSTAPAGIESTRLLRKRSMFDIASCSSANRALAFSNACRSAIFASSASIAEVAFCV